MPITFFRWPDALPAIYVPSHLTTSNVTDSDEYTMAISRTVTPSWPRAAS